MYSLHSSLNSLHFPAAIPFSASLFFHAHGDVSTPQLDVTQTHLVASIRIPRNLTRAGRRYSTLMNNSPRGTCLLRAIGVQPPKQTLRYGCLFTLHRNQSPGRLGPYGKPGSTLYVPTIAVFNTSLGFLGNHQT